MVTADFLYFRLRKTDYSADDRAEVRRKAAAYLRDGKTVFLFFKHEDTPAGALYAEEMLSLNTGAAQ